MASAKLATFLICLVVMPMAANAQISGCAAYDSQIWAQSVYERDASSHAALDPDGNGIACDALPLGAAPALWTDALPTNAVPATLASVTDGDTIRISVDGRNEPVRLILIDTPETRRPGSPIECFGREATAYLKWLLSLGGRLYVERDVSERDRYDRLLRYVWLDLDGEVYLVNEVMVRSGYASLSTYPPDVKYVDQIREAATFAREHEYGLWSTCIEDDELSAFSSASDARVIFRGHYYRAGLGVSLFHQCRSSVFSNHPQLRHVSLDFHIGQSGEGYPVWYEGRFRDARTNSGLDFETEGYRPSHASKHFLGSWPRFV